MSDWGLWAYLVVLIGGPAVLALLAAGGLAVTRSTLKVSAVVAGFAMALGMAALLTGAIGRISANRRALSAVARAAPDDRQLLLRSAEGEMRLTVQLGGALGLPSLLGGLALLVSASVRLGREGGAP